MPETNGVANHTGEEEGFAYISEAETGEVSQEPIGYSQNPEVISRAKEIVGTAMREINRGFVESAVDLGQLISSFDIWDVAQDTSPDTWGSYPFYVPPLYRQSQKRGEVIPIYLDENQLRFLRDRSRKLCAENPFAIAAIENRVNYCVGEDGFAIKAVAAPGVELTPTIQRYVDRTQRVIDRWSEFNDMPEIEEWMMSQPDINGDAFVRHFFQKSGLVIHRPIECEHVRSPSGSAYGPHYSFGIQTDPHDVMSVEGYWVIEDPIVDQRPTFVPANEVTHVKRHTPLSAKRGMPLFYSCELLLRSSLELLRGVVTTANIRARFAVIRKFTNNVVKEAAQQMVQELQNFSVTDPSTGQVLNVEKKPIGSITNTSSNVEYEFPSSQLDAQIYEVALQMVLRAVACRCNMPEWMFTADASNANYSSSLVSEAPSTKSFGKIQKRLVKVVGINKAKGKESLAWIQVKHAVKCGILAPETLKLVALSCEGPTIVVRDKAGEAAMNREYYSMKAKSRTMIQQEQGWDGNKIKKQLLEEAQDDLNLAAVQQEGQIRLQMTAQEETGGGQIYQTQLGNQTQLTDQPQQQQPGQGQDQDQQQPGQQLGKQFQPYYEEGHDGKAPSGRARLEALLHEGVTIDVAKALRKAGKFLAKHTNPSPMPGYGQIFASEDEVWYVGGDGDEDGFYKVIKKAIKKAYPGVRKIHYEAEAFPPEDKGWIQVYPKNISESWEEEQRDAIGRWMQSSKGSYSGQLNRVSAGLYQYVRADGKKFVIARGEVDSGQKLWHVHEQTGNEINQHSAPLSATHTIDEAIRYCEGDTNIREDLVPGGLGDDKPDSEFDAIQLKAGIKVEMEHTNDPRIAKEITKDHLTEDGNYYKKLKKVEESVQYEKLLNDYTYLCEQRSVLQETEGVHSYSSTQFNIKDNIYFTKSNSLNPAVEILKYAMSIPDGELAKDGREGTSHVTIKYGLHTQDCAAVAKVIKDFGKVRIRLGKTSVFAANESKVQRGGDKYDVLKIDVEGEDIHKLNELLSKSLLCTDSFPVYRPHITIAYLKPGCGELYSGYNYFEGWEIEFDKLCFSNAKGDKAEICLVRNLSTMGDDGHDYTEGKAKPQFNELLHEGIAKTRHKKTELISEILAAIGGTEFANTLEHIVSNRELFEASDWVPYHGPEGGKGRKNIKTGRIEYGEFEMRPSPHGGTEYRGTTPYIGMSDAFYKILRQKNKRPIDVAKDPALFNEMFEETKKNASGLFSKEHFADFVKGFLNFKPRKLTKTEQRRLGFGTLSDAQKQANTEALLAARDIKKSSLNGVRSPAHAKALLDHLSRLTMNQLREMRTGLDERIDPEAQKRILNSIGLAALIVASVAVSAATVYAGWTLLKKTPKLLRNTLRWLKSELDKADSPVQEAEEIVDKKDEERKQLLLSNLNKIADILYGVYGKNILAYLDETNDVKPDENIEEAIQEANIDEAYNGMKTVIDKNGRRYEVQFINGKPVKGHKKITQLNQKHAEDHPRTEYQLSKLGNELAQVSQKTEEPNAYHAAETIRLMGHASSMRIEQLHHQFGQHVTKEQREGVIKRIAKFAAKAGLVLGISVTSMLALDYVGQKLIDKMPEGAFWKLWDDLGEHLKNIGPKFAPKPLKMAAEGINLKKQTDTIDKEIFDKWSAQPEWKKFLDKALPSQYREELILNNKYFQQHRDEEKSKPMQEAIVANDFSGLLEVLVEGEVRYRRYNNGVQVPLESGYRPSLV